jgi:trans-aconitate 2-methyltransferase
MTLEWDASSYDRISEMQLASGRDFLDQVPLRGDEVAIDAGCGTGRITELLAERLPEGRVIGVDASEQMIEGARERLGGSVELIHSDLFALDPPEPVDLVFSTATLHWIRDHDRLYAAILPWLKRGGLFAAQFGGKGNFAEVTEPAAEVARRPPFAEHLSGFEYPWHFPTPEEAAERLRRAGFADVRCVREERDYLFEQPREFHRTVALAVHLDRLPESLREQFLDTVLAQMPDPARGHLIRTNIFARHP